MISALEVAVCRKVNSVARADNLEPPRGGYPLEIECGALEHRFGKRSQSLNVLVCVCRPPRLFASRLFCDLGSLGPNIAMRVGAVAFARRSRSRSINAEANVRVIGANVKFIVSVKRTPSALVRAKARINKILERNFGHDVKFTIRTFVKV